MRGGRFIVPIALLLAGCVSGEPEASGLSHWRAVARQRLLAGESAAEFTRLRREAAAGNRRQELPDLARLVRTSPGERSAVLTADILRECVAVASARLVPNGETVSSVARQLHARTLDCQSAVMLAEKAMLDATLWKDAAARTRETELESELRNRFGVVPPPDSYVLPAPEAFPVTPMPDVLRRHYGDDPAAPLRFGAVILALPGELARQLIADPGFNPDGIWLEARRLAALAALHGTETELRRAVEQWRADPSPRNLFRCRRWYFRRELELSAVPLLRGSEADLRALESLMELLPPF